MGKLRSLVKKEACEPVLQHPLPYGIETRFKSSQDLVITERPYVSFNGCAVRPSATSSWMLLVAACTYRL
jgi:hypothetical protein